MNISSSIKLISSLMTSNNSLMLQNKPNKWYCKSFTYLISNLGLEWPYVYLFYIQKQWNRMQPRIWFLKENWQYEIVSSMENEQGFFGQFFPKQTKTKNCCGLALRILKRLFTILIVPSLFCSKLGLNILRTFLTTHHVNYALWVQRMYFFTWKNILLKYLY